jgi:alanine-glyoxylate transaminase/serine-glyoxylate transaminase/serine-pyruvate transaminase
MISLLNGPVYIPPHVKAALAEPICDLRNPRFLEAYDFSRERVAHLLGADNYGTVLASGSGTFGVELVLRSCLGASDRVLALLMGTFSQRMAEIAELTGAQVRQEWAPIGDVVSLERVEELFKEETPRYLLVAHVEPSTGTQVDLVALAALCHRYAVTPIVDGVCAGFAISVDSRRDHLGAYITASQKGLALPPGMTVAVVSPELMAVAQKTPLSNTGLYGHLRSWGTPKPLFTPPILHIFALAESLRHIERETVAVRTERHRRMAEQVRAWGRRHHLKMVPVRPEVAALTLSAFYYPEGLDDAWLYALRDQEGLELAPSNDLRLAGRYFRIGHLGDLPAEHLDQGLAILDRSLATSTKTAVPEGVL